MGDRKRAKSVGALFLTIVGLALVAELVAVVIQYWVVGQVSSRVSGAVVVGVAAAVVIANILRSNKPRQD